jgi:aryl-alcohol dehydrogenase-like predicted oxidoreductase
MIPAALNPGFRHFDTAQIYRNEADVGECVAASGLRRGDVFLTTKIWVENYPDLVFCGFSGPKPAQASYGLHQPSAAARDVTSDKPDGVADANATLNGPSFAL